MKKVQIFFRGITEIVGSSEMGLLILANEPDTKQIAIICDKYMEYEFSLRIGKPSSLTR